MRIKIEWETFRNIHKYSVDEVKSLLAVGEKMLITNTSGQACFSYLAKKYGVSQYRLSQVATAKKTASDDIPVKKVDEWKIRLLPKPITSTF